MNDLLIPSFLMSNVSESFRSLTKNEQCERIAQVAHQKWAMLVNRSGHSPKMRDHEQITQVALQKGANEWITSFFYSKSLICSFFCKKTSDTLRKQMSEFPALHFWPFCENKGYFLILCNFNWCKKGRRILDLRNPSVDDSHDKEKNKQIQVIRGGPILDTFRTFLGYC